MSGNSFGKLFTLTTAGESHGDALIGIVDGCPPGMELSEADLQGDLDLRKPGSSRHTTQRRESDAIKIVSGTFEGVTTGTPIALVIENTDQRPRDYTNIANSFRPGHADFTYQQKYGIRDYRGGGRSSARETAIRVAAGGIAKKYLKSRYGIEINGYVAQLGPITFENFDWKEVHNNPFFCPDASKVSELEDYMDKLRKSGDSIGARINIVASNMITGLGEPIFDRLDADIAHAMLSINAVKGVEIGAGFGAAVISGEDNADEMRMRNGEVEFQSNQAGGILGGISTGQDIIIRFAVKPTSSILTPRKTVTKQGRNAIVETKGRHDPCVGIRGVPVGEAMAACVLADHLLRHRGQCD